MGIDNSQEIRIIEIIRIKIIIIIIIIRIIFNNKK
jgi:hypothetical protein